MTRYGTNRQSRRRNQIVVSPSHDPVALTPAARRLQQATGLTSSDVARTLENRKYAVADSTRELYEKHWRYFRQWCESRDVSPLPAAPYLVEAYIAERAEYVAISTVQNDVAAIRQAHIAHEHPSPTNHPEVRAAVRNARRRYPQAPDQVEGLDKTAFIYITASAYEQRAGESKGKAQRRASTDIALIGLMRDAMMRRHEAGAAKWNQLEKQVGGHGVINIPLSKTDRFGVGEVAYVSAATMDLLDAMKELRTTKRSDPDDPIFAGMQGRQISNRIAAAAKQAGLEGRYSGHSPRIGMAQDLARDDTELPSMMQAGRWKSPEMPARYIRKVTAAKGPVARWYERHHTPTRVRTL